MRPSRRGLARGLLAATALACGGCTPTRPVELPEHDGSTARLVIDVRDPVAFAAGHDPGALNLQWGWNQLPERIAAYVPDRETPLAVRAATPVEAAIAAGLLEGRGYVDVTSAPAEPGSTTLPTTTARSLAARLDAGEDLHVLDVRERWEHALGTIPGATKVDPDEAPSLLPTLDPEADHFVICEAGYRSGQLASWLRRHGLRATNVIDGMAGWRALDR